MGIADWFQSLMGKSGKEKRLLKDLERQMNNSRGFISANNESGEAAGQETEDSVKKELLSFKKFMEKTVGGISKKVEPIAATTQQAAAKKNTSVSSKLPKSTFPKVIKILVIALLVIILIFVLLSIFRMAGQQGGGDSGKPDVTNKATPTPIVYQPYRPSVYAEDPEIASLELDITVLENELFRSSIREDRLSPPRLDFEVNFK